VGPQGAAVAEVHPAAEHDPPVAAARGDLDVPAEEDEALGDDLRVPQPETTNRQ
jgi:hypothetical protein